MRRLLDGSWGTAGQKRVWADGQRFVSDDLE